jgi:hypothetical protein
MHTKLSRWLAVHLLSVVLISWCGATTKAAENPQTWHLVRIPDPVARRAAIDALEAASARFADAECRRVLTDFEGGNGRSLADQLTSLAVDIQGYLRMVTSSMTRATPDAPVVYWRSPLQVAASCASAWASSN